MKKLKLINYWNKFYAKNKQMKESSFARFIKRKIKNYSGKLIDIGCGNGRDSLFFSRNGQAVLGVDISKKAIANNSKISNNNLKFLRLDIAKTSFNRKFDYIYCRFFLHAIDHKDQQRLFNFIKKIKKKNTYCFFEFRNHNDKIFKKKTHNDFVEFEKGHYRRIINPLNLVEELKKNFDIKILYLKSSKNLSIIKKDNPNLTRIIFNFRK
jgi:tellurite methyltransferase